MKRSKPPGNVQRVLRLLGYLWTSPNTLIGLVFCVIARVSGGEASVVDGVIEAHGGWTRPALRPNPFMRNGIAAITFGHVVIGADQFRLERTRVHERVHVRQYAICGPFFLPLYFLSSAWCLVRRVDPYRQNVFERQAYRIEAEWRERFT